MSAARRTSISSSSSSSSSQSGVMLNSCVVSEKLMGFQCQQFYLKDDRCAMKVSTDSLLFGSWLSVVGVKRAADFGTGCGILALMLAQRLAAEAPIDAIEFDLGAAQQARENVLNSPWPNQIKVHHSDVLVWQSTSTFDLIVMNPPYFAHHLQSEQSTRQLARQGQGDVWLDWLQQGKRLLTTNGRIALVAPYSAITLLNAAATGLNLHPSRYCEVSSLPSKAPYLVMLELGGTPTVAVETEHLTIRDAQNKYTDEFRQLTGAFYLN